MIGEVPAEGKGGVENGVFAMHGKIDGFEIALGCH